MRTSRLKNIVIVILLLVNVFLLVLLLSRRAEERGANERRIEQLCELFERSGVTFDRALLPEVSSPLSLSLSFERPCARSRLCLRSARQCRAQRLRRREPLYGRIGILFHSFRRHS